MGDESDSAGSPGAQKRIPGDHKSGTYSSDLHWFAGLLFRLVGVHQDKVVVGYPDASPFVGVPSIAPGAGHVRDGLCDCLGSAWQLSVGRSFWPGARKPRCNSADHGRSGCR